MRRLIALVLVYLVISISFGSIVFADNHTSDDNSPVDRNFPRVVGALVFGDDGRDYVLTTDVNVIVSVDIVEESLNKEGVKADLSELNSNYGDSVVADECEDQGENHWFCYWKNLQANKVGRVSITFDAVDNAGNSVDGVDDGVNAEVYVREVKEGDNWEVYAEEIDEVNKNFLELGDLSVIVPLVIESKGDTELLSFDVECDLGNNVVSYEKVVYPDLSGAYLEVILSGINSEGSITRVSDDARRRTVENNLGELENLGERGGDVFRTGNFLKIDSITGNLVITGMAVADEISFNCKSVIEQVRERGSDIIYYEPEIDEFEVKIETRDSFLPSAEEVVVEDIKGDPFGFLGGPYKMLKSVVDFGTSICDFSTKIEVVLSLLANIPVIGANVYPIWEKYTRIWQGDGGSGFKGKGLRSYCEYVTCVDCSEDNDSPLPKVVKEISPTQLDPFKSIYGALSCKPVCVTGVVFFLEKWRAIAEGKERCKKVAIANGMGTHQCSDWYAGAVCQEITGELWEVGIGSRLRGEIYSRFNELWKKNVEERLKDLLGGPAKTLIDAYFVLDSLKDVQGRSKGISNSLAKPVELSRGESVEKKNPNRYPAPEVRYD